MISSRRFFILVFVLSVFVAGLWQGFSKAAKKPLWIDEIYTQVTSVEGKSWSAVWLGSTGQGSNGPMFYSIQKIICAASGYKSNDLWNNKGDVYARFILRASSIFCMSLGLALIVWFFCVHYSLLGGLITFIMSITSYLVWYYLAEARPYALMFLATAIQALVLLYYYRFDRKPRCWSVGVANLFLAFVSPLSVIQIASSGAVLWFKGCRRVWPLLWGVVLPLGIGFGYYTVSVHCPFWFLPYGQPLALILANIPSGRLWVFFIFPLLIWVWDKYLNKRREYSLWPFFAWGWLTFIGYVLFLTYLSFIQQPQKGYEICNRYLMSLTPLGIIVATTGILEFVQRPKALWVKLIAWAAILMIILPRLVKAYRWMIG